MIYNSALLQDLMVLLDLIGTETSKFHSWFPITDRHFQRLSKIGKFKQMVSMAACEEHIRGAGWGSPNSSFNKIIGAYS